MIFRAVASPQRQGGGALAPPIFEISISKNTILAPKIGEKVCLAPQSIFSPPKTKVRVTPLSSSLLVAWTFAPLALVEGTEGAGGQRVCNFSVERPHWRRQYSCDIFLALCPALKLRRSGRLCLHLSNVGLASGVERMAVSRGPGSVGYERKFIELERAERKTFGAEPSTSKN